MVDKVVSRHGARLPRLAPLQETFVVLQHELLDHMKKEDVVLFPAIVALEAGAAPGRSAGWTWIDQPIGAMEAEHASAGAALERIAELTDGHVPPEDACPTSAACITGCRSSSATCTCTSTSRTTSCSRGRRRWRVRSRATPQASGVIEARPPLPTV